MLLHLELGGGTVTDGEQSITVTRTVRAPAHVLFDFLSRPGNHHALDTSGMIREAQDESPIGGVGTTFLINMRNDFKGDHRIENHVVVHEPDRAIGWAPGEPGQPAAGHTFVWRLVTAGQDTEVSQIYDWSRNSDPEAQPYLPLIGREQLEHSLELLARATEPAD
ncbi:hypothetical protein [Actinomycetospora termitidis]|uniref:Polyketide cyclase n=1 Tax=Actinomycetospora termitidis TaxID=3053470 RepID=A0ABT7MCE6_9PSEU|nr:hypothetical protein [Actinomycetospora sp. Odt1-22]MDL5158335.1 hypothetical protein [Actinomycetospora sp. Odt1-22]